MLPNDRTPINDVCLAFLHELAEPLTAIACHTGAARRLSASHQPENLATIADSLEQIRSEIIRASDVVKRFRSYIQKEAKQQLDSVEKTTDEPVILSGK
jgi:phosphoglycerate-specific signal transduction histidine kinase